MARLAGRMTRGIAALGLALGLALASGCSPIVRNHGYVPSEEDLSFVVVGVDTRDTVASAVGRPSAAGLMNDGGFYYVRSRWETVAWRAPEEVERQVVAITFDDEGVVENVERFTLADGQVVPLSRRVTETGIRNVSLIRQLLGSIGNFSAAQLTDRPR